MTELKKLLIEDHPLIRFNFSIVEKTLNENNPKTRQILIVENILSQFAEFEMFITTQNTVDKEFLWQTYENDSIPKKDKLPKDWFRRKDTTWKRDNCKCTRCGFKITLNDAQLHIVKEIKNGGTYHFENLLTVCNDCYRILNTDNLGKTVKYLNITESLMNKVSSK
ncbi:MAG: HNH endonuclease [Campylobacteraceae bacterium]|nr:HNH endonuclease [Campylobacteraceae bacterium]